MQKIDNFLHNNKIWADKLKTEDPAFFEQSAKEQKPELLWIGCSDSRVPAEVVVGALPGEMFIHRNIANQVIATDFNCLSVLQYAINVLQVKHVVVCGHYNCGGVKAALAKQDASLLITNKWLMHIKNVYRLHQHEIDSQPTEEERVNKLVELNILEQVHALSHTSIVQEAWKRENRPILHGWVYNLKDGLLNPLIKLDQEHTIHPIYECE